MVSSLCQHRQHGKHRQYKQRLGFVCLAIAAPSVAGKELLEEKQRADGGGLSSREACSQSRYPTDNERRAAYQLRSSS